MKNEITVLKNQKNFKSVRTISLIRKFSTVSSFRIFHKIKDFLFTKKFAKILTSFLSILA